MDSVSYRVLAYLLLGIVKIYSKKVEYMLHDSDDLLVRINKFLSNRKSNTSAAETSRTVFIIPDILQLDAIDVVILEDTTGYHTAPPEQITLKDVLPITRGFVQFSHERFDDFGFDEASCSVSLNKSRELEIEHNKAMEVVRSLCDMYQEVVDIDGALNFPEKSQDYESNEKEKSDHDESSVVKESVEDLIEEHETEENSELRKKASFEDGKSSVIPSESTIVDITPQSKFPGSTTSEFKLIPTPASTQDACFSRKRKLVFDETTVLSNKVLKKCIHDASDLVTNRRPLDRSLRDKQRKFHISNLLNELNESLFPTHSPKCKSSLSSKKLKIPVSLKMQETGLSESQAYDMQEHHKISQVIAPRFSDSRGNEETQGKADVSESQTSDDQDRMATAPKTPPLCPNSKVSSGTHEEKNEIQNSDDFEPSSPHESIGREQSLERSNDIIEEEINSSMTENPKTAGWSERTRKVATYLNKNFQDLGEQNEKYFVNLTQVSQGRTRKESARLFYEILVLKTTNHVDVKQNKAYGDIVVKKLPKFYQTFGVDGFKI